MIRKIVLSAIAGVALTFGGFAPLAQADTPTPVPEATPTPVVCLEVGYNGCIAYPEGGFGAGAESPTATPVPQPTATPVVVADDATATTGTTATATADAASIAFTGSESRVLGYVGAGMIGFGAIALAAARRRNDDTLD